MKIKNTVQRLKLKHPRMYYIVLIGLAIILLGLLFWFAYLYLPIGGDWAKAFRPATFYWLRGGSPYDIYSFYNPPWLLILLTPFALMPERIGSILICGMGIVSYAILLRKLNANLLTTTVFLFSPPVLQDLLTSNINWLVLLGYLMPPSIGLFFVLLKPQVGFAVAIYWLVEAWQKGRIRQVLKTFMPVTLVTLLSFVIYGFWPAKAPNLSDAYWNVSLWPLSIPIGLVLLAIAFRRKQIRYAYMVSPFFSPYVGAYSYVTTLLGLVPSTLETIVAVVGLWIAMIAGGLFR